jgi:hypothetical protein
MKKMIALIALIPSLALGDDCTPYFHGMYNGFPSDRLGAGHWFIVKGASVTARGTGGFTTYAVDRSYRQNMTLPQKAALDRFYMFKNAAGDTITGSFLILFPGRADGVLDAMTLRIRNNGTVELVLNSWGNTVGRLSNLQCYRGHTNSTFVLTARNRSSAWGLDLWTFTITPSWLE